MTWYNTLGSAANLHISPSYLTRGVNCSDTPVVPYWHPATIIVVEIAEVVAVVAAVAAGVEVVAAVAAVGVVDSCPV
jgi:hypothetical protein